MTPTRQTLLDTLAEGPVRGPAFAERHGVTRAAVWKQVEALRDAGFEIEAGEEGYRVVAIPEYGAEAVRYDLRAPYDVEFHDALASTNDRARELAAEGASAVVVLRRARASGPGMDRTPGWGVRLDTRPAGPAAGSRPSVDLSRRRRRRSRL